MTNLSSVEKKALEEVFVVLDERKNCKLEFIKFICYCKGIFLPKLLLVRK